eukprot:1161968-Pelagomonas_calceolata.AAC.12
MRPLVKQARAQARTVHVKEATTSAQHYLPLIPDSRKRTHIHIHTCNHGHFYSTPDLHPPPTSADLAILRACGQGVGSARDTAQGHGRAANRPRGAANHGAPADVERAVGVLAHSLQCVRVCVCLRAHAFMCKYA